MKKTRLLTVFLTLLMLLSALLLTACEGSPNGRLIVSSEINNAGELVVTYSDGTQSNLGAVSIGGATTIMVNDEGGDVSSAAAKGLSSAVKISASFTKTVKNPYYPGFGSQGGSKSEYSSAGSGVIYKLDQLSGSAFIITNYHVVYDSASDTGISENIEIYLYGAEDEKYAIPAQYVGGSLYYDIAVLCVNDCDALKGSVYSAADAPTAERVYAGQSAIAVGNPENYGISVSLGIVSVASEYITMTASDGTSAVTQRVIRIDTAVNSGNSGGGLYNSRGELIGIVNAKIIDEAVENIAYAIPSEVAFAVADNIIDNCFAKENKSVMRATLGVSLEITDSKAVINTDNGNIDIEESVSVHSVSSGAIADGFLLPGDVLVSARLGEKEVIITRQHHIIDLMLNARVGDVLELSIMRDGDPMTVSIAITESSLLLY